MDWMHVAKVRVQLLAFMSMVMKLQVP